MLRDGEKGCQAAYLLSVPRMSFTLAAGMCIMPTFGTAKKENVPWTLGNDMKTAIGVNSCNS
jgi:hypothetical protein